MRLINADRLIMDLLSLWQYFLERKRAKETMIIWTVITRVKEMAEEESWKHELSKERQRTANARPTHECVKTTHECVDLISRQAALDAISTFGNREYRRKQGTLRDAYKLISALPYEPVGKSDTLNRTCANCKHYTEEHLCVFWSYFGFSPKDYCSRWEGTDDE